jgi:endonuclease/exonuclease/phosphatase family metal-dependent hydrolase
MFRTVASTVSLTAVLVCGGCSEDDGGSAGGPARVATFNAGLAFGYVEEASARVDPIVDAISASDYDVLCLQELWTSQNMDGTWTTSVIEDLLTRVSGTYPESYWQRTTVPEDAPLTGCEIAEADQLLACADPACGDVPPENLADCVLANCSAEFDMTSSSCQSCMVANLGMPLDAIVSACRGQSRGGIVYDGHNGLALLSKHPLTSTSVLELQYALTARAVLHAEIDLPGHGPTDVYCTHLAADLSASVAYPPNSPFESYAGENLAQINALLSYVDTSGSTGQNVLAGDFNTGPAVGDTQAELPQNYQRIVSSGYADPVFDLGQCSFCDANILVGGQGAGGQMIDHVFLPENLAGDATAEIVFDTPVDIIGADGQPTQVNLSDHYGVAVEF